MVARCNVICFDESGRVRSQQTAEDISFREKAMPRAKTPSINPSIMVGGPMADAAIIPLVKGSLL